jgi:hypothetical protein
MDGRFVGDGHLREERMELIDNGQGWLHTLHGGSRLWVAGGEVQD